MAPPASRRVPARAFLAALLLGLPLLPFALASHAQDDAGVSGDAGDDLASARSVTPYGLYEGELAAEPGDQADTYAFPLAAGESVNIEIRVPLAAGQLFAPDNDKRASFRLLGPHGQILDTPLTSQADSRVTLLSAPVSGTYYFQVTKPGFEGEYAFCFVVVDASGHSCPDHGLRPIGVLSPGALFQERTRVLVIPPPHGDLGNPAGPNARDYLDAVLEGIHAWEDAIADFVADHPTYSYLSDIEIVVQVYDGVVLEEPDVVVTFVETGGPAFRGFAGSCGTYPPRCIALSLFSASPRGGQLVPDYPERNDLRTLVMHEFGHGFGLGHTLTWDATEGPDLMNSPAPFVYGDGDPAGDGGERTDMNCISSLDLYALAQLYAWIPSGSWNAAGASSYSLPAGMDYERYC